MSFFKLSLFLAAGLAAAQSDCACYKTDGASAATYSNRIYHDFRSLSGDYADEPENVTSQAESSAPVQAGYLSSDAFINDWGIQTWAAEPGEDIPLKKQYSNKNVYIENTGSSTHLTLRTYRNADFVSTAELDSKLSTIQHASIRVRARVRGSSGACAGIFTYYDDDNESDIEILTKDPTNHIRYTNQPGLDDSGNEIPGASTNAVMSGGAVWSDWVDYRLDWTDGLSVWFVNGVENESKTYGVPQVASSVLINMWSDGGSWSGDLDVGAAAYLDIETIEIFYNTSEGSPQCSSTCDV